MNWFTKNEGPCSPCQDLVGINEMLELDLRELYRMLASVDSFYEEIYDWHCDTPGWDSIHQHLGTAVGTLRNC
jgi:hypothetical protein